MYNYTWDKWTNNDIARLGHKLPARIPISALVSGASATFNITLPLINDLRIQAPLPAATTLLAITARQP